MDPTASKKHISKENKLTELPEPLIDCYLCSGRLELRTTRGNNSDQQRHKYHPPFIVQSPLITLKQF